MRQYAARRRQRATRAAGTPGRHASKGQSRAKLLPAKQRRPRRRQLRVRRYAADAVASQVVTPRHAAACQQNAR